MESGNTDLARSLLVLLMFAQNIAHTPQTHTGKKRGRGRGRERGRERERGVKPATI